jgi:thioredoxin 1
LNVVTAIHFWATSSGPSKTLSPVFEGLSNENENIKFCKIDVDELQDLAQELAISTVRNPSYLCVFRRHQRFAELFIQKMPTFMIFKDGKKVDELVGADEGKLKVCCVLHYFSGCSELKNTN